jgi:hypothetical protein
MFKKPRSLRMIAIKKTCPDCGGSGQILEKCPKSRRGYPHLYYKPGQSRTLDKCELCGKPRKEDKSGICPKCKGACFIDKENQDEKSD